LLGKADEQTPALGLPAERRPQRSQNRGHGNVRTVELIGNRLRKPNSNPLRAPLDHQRVALIPNAVGQSRHQRRDRRKDATTSHIRAYVACERAAIDQNRYRNRWE
jgi:hypothetical protein